ncbi:MAG: hypothetical protein AAGI01_00010 [Myxococcota bacterium]
MTLATRQRPCMLSIIVAATALLFAACGEPDRAWTLEQYDAHKALVDELDKELGQAFEAFEPKSFGALSKMSDEERAELERAQETRRRAFDAAALKVLEGAKDEGLIGWEITYSFPKVEDPPSPYGFDALSGHVPSYTPGTLRWDKREEFVGEESQQRRISWGLYQIPGKEMKTSMMQEIPDYHAGFEIHFPVERGDAQLDVSLFIAPKDD